MLGREIEFKYKATIPVDSFVKICKKKINNKYTFVTGSDMFYGTPCDPKAFFRVRIGSDLEQLTYKKKIKDNNVIREEYNVDLVQGNGNAMVRILEAMGFQYNFTLKKSAFIFKTESYIVVYYICYDENRKELGRFIEIELAEDLPWVKAEHALDSLRELEKQFSVLKIGPTKRIKRSLWEMFKKGKA